jgi:hypothetical protein
MYFHKKDKKKDSLDKIGGQLCSAYTIPLSIVGGIATLMGK